MEKYYINFSYASNNWLVKEVGEGEEAGKIIQIFLTKKAAEEYLSKLEKTQDAKRSL